MTGTIFNTLSIFILGFLGFFIKKSLPKETEKAVMQMIGIAVCFISVMGFLASAMTVENGKINTSGEILLLISLVAGMFIGEIIKLDDKINNFGKKIEEKAGVDGFSKGFIYMSLLSCVGAMSVFGAIQDGISGDSSILIVKSAIDGITSFIMGSAMGIGVPFAAFSVLIYQGAIALASEALQPFVTDEMMTGICIVGYAIVAMIGTNVMGITKIKIANTLPAILVPIAYILIFG